MFKIMKVNGLELIIERANREASKFQYLRETLVNAAEAGATRFHVGMDRDFFEESGRSRLLLADDGHGMDQDELTSYMSGFGASSKEVGGPHQNYGVGAKISLAPWNPRGVTFGSWTKLGASSALRIVRRGGVYGVDVDAVQAAAVHRYPWQTSGTTIICHGSESVRDTFMGPTGDASPEDLSNYISRRFWRLPMKVTVEGHDGRDQRVTAIGDMVKKLTEHEGEILAKDAKIRWHLLKSPAPEVAGIYTLYNNEVYEFAGHTTQYARYGVFYRDIRERLVIEVTPLALGRDGTHGAYPNNTRVRLHWMEGGTMGELPVESWARAFSKELPDEIRAMEESLSGAGDRSGHRWKHAVITVLSRIQGHVAFLGPGSLPTIRKAAAGTKRKEDANRQPAAAKKRAGRRVNCPEWRVAAGRHFSAQDGTEDDVAGMWVPPHAGAPLGELVLNQDFSGFRAVIDYWRARYPAAPRSAIESAVYTVYGTLGVTRILHGSVFAKAASWGSDRVETYINSPEGITAGMLGILDADHRISAALSGRYGKAVE